MFRFSVFKFLVCFLFLFSFFSGSSVLFAQNGAKKNILNEAGKETVERQEMEIKADQLVNDANKALSKNSFQEAVNNYLQAIEYLKKCSYSSSYIQNKIEKCNDALSKAYSYWADDMAANAEKLIKVQDYDKAISLCEEAIKIYPPSKKKFQDKIQQYTKMKDVVTFRKNISESKINPDKENRDYDLEVKIKQGAALYSDGQYDKARDKFEEVLSIDPYQMKAIEYVRKINNKIDEKGNARRKVTHGERIAETEWKMVTPIVPRTLSGEAESVTNSTPKAEATSKIQQKLNDIIIDNIQFEDTTVPTVLKWLRKRSKDLDPDKVGVNIFLRLSGKKGAEGGTAATTTEEGGESTTTEAPTSVEDLKPITMDVPDIPLGVAIEYICRLSNLKFRVEKHAVIIASKDVALDELETKIYPLDKEALDIIGTSDQEAVKKHFENRGIEFPTGAKIVYDNRIGRLIVTNTPDNLRKIEEIIHSELNTVDPQVLVQAKFVEITQDDLEELGFQYTLQKNAASGATGARETTWQPNDNVVRNAGNLYGHPDILYNRVDTWNDYVKSTVVIHALDQSNTADVLSSPRITTVNGQEATVRMVTDFYYPTSWNDATVATISTTTGNNAAATTGSESLFSGSTPAFGEPTEEGIILKVKPMVDADRYTINVDMNPVVQERTGWTDYSYDITVGGNASAVPPVASITYRNVIRMPTIEARTIDTSVTIYDGETIVLGGVIRDTTNVTNDQYPILGDLPFIGRAFQSKIKSSTKTNLLIFLTCRLVNPDGSPIRAREQRGLPAFRQ